MLARNRAELFDACKTIFGPEVSVSDDFLRYLQPFGLKTAYRKRAFETHPDRARAVGDHSADMHQRFQQVRSAYDVLLQYVENRSRRITGEPVFNGRRRQQYAARNHRQRGARRASDHYYQGRLPQRSLLLGQYLYYSGRISWRDLIDAIVWQSAQRPKIGQLALQSGIMSNQQVVTVLSHRSGSERFCDCARRFGFISSRQRATLIGQQRRMQRCIGEYFVENGLVSSPELSDLVAAQHKHNKRAFAW
ncbi:MAG: J domain-containing protein [Deltaproteobacteria bacterium]|nr:J domain-containing protein [Deltaproteobacteria bacterium]